MEGARRIDGQVVSYTDAALAALEAGCDLVLLCNQSLGEGKAVDELIDGLAAAQAKGRWQPNVDSESRRLALLPETLPQPWDELMLQPAYMQALDLCPDGESRAVQTREGQGTGETVALGAADWASGSAAVTALGQGLPAPAPHTRWKISAFGICIHALPGGC